MEYAKVAQGLCQYNDTYSRAFASVAVAACKGFFIILTALLAKFLHLDQVQVKVGIVLCCKESRREALPVYGPGFTLF